MNADEIDAVWAAHESTVSAVEVEQAVSDAAEDEVVCRVCAERFGQITDQHLQTHGMSLSEYQLEHTDAPIYPSDPDRRPGREPGFSHSEETKLKIGEKVRQSRNRGVDE